MQYEQRKNCKRQQGFTLVEVLMVVFIIAMLSAIIIPRVSASSETARKNTDIATGHQIKSALDRYQVENGRYPKATEVTADSAGNITAPILIPKYVGKLSVDTTQQEAEEGKKGFGIGTLENGVISEDEETNLIMLYLTADGSGAEVRVYDSEIDDVLWSSAN